MILARVKGDVKGSMQEAAEKYVHRHIFSLFLFSMVLSEIILSFKPFFTHFLAPIG
jgi:hypothetical protein